MFNLKNHSLPPPPPHTRARTAVSHRKTNKTIPRKAGLPGCSTGIVISFR